MTAKQYLGRYLNAARSIRATLEQIECLRSIAAKSTTTISDAPGSVGAQDRTGNLVARVVDMSREVDEATEQIAIIRGEVEAAIGTVEDKTLRDLLTHRYIGGWDWGRIAGAIGRYSVDYVRKELHEQALKEIAQYIVV